MKNNDEELLERRVWLDSNFALAAFREEENYSFEALLDLFSGADVPMMQEEFDSFYRRLIELAPKHNLKEDIRVYRGTSEETLDEYGIGYVWTQDKELAAKFALHCCDDRYKRFGCIDRTPKIVTALATPENIVYKWINGRNEQEVFIKSPWNLDGITRMY